MPDLTCGRSYRNPDSEARAVAMREGEQTPFSGCGKPLRWLYAYRCRQCGRWLHGPCMDKHFGGESATLAALQQRVERLTGALLSLVGDASGYDPSIVRGMALDFRRIATTDFHRDLCERVLSAEEQARAALAGEGTGVAEGA